jgi:uncharacterized protein YmfQ (DUF2313 family)
MGIAVASRERYESSIKKLFPQGDYWDGQFADSTSDVSLFVKARLDELIRFRGRMSELQDESRVETADELIADWERALLGETIYGKTLTERRLFLKSRENNKLNRAEMEKIAQMYGLTIADVTFPYRPGFFGFSRFRASFIGSPATFSVLRITALQENFRERVWALIHDEYPQKQLGAIHCGSDRLVCFPAYKLRDFMLALQQKSAFGYFRAGANRLFPSPSYKIKPIVEKRLAASSLGFARFGTSRLVYSPIPAFRRIVAKRTRQASFGFARFGLCRLVYTTVYETHRTVYKGLRSTSAGFVLCGITRLLPIPLNKIRKMFFSYFRSMCFGFIRFGLSRIAKHTEERFRMLRFGMVRFGRKRVVQYDKSLCFKLNTNWLFIEFAENLIQKSAVIPISDAQMVDAIIRDSGILPQFDAGLVQELILQNGLMPRFDKFFMNETLQETKFLSRLERTLINRMILERRLFSDFEQAIQEKLLASQIAYFNYEGA